MRLPWLLPFAAGTALAAGAWIATTFVLRDQTDTKEIVLEYKRPWGKIRSDDPGSEHKNVGDYLVFIADRCAVKNWKLDGTIGWTDIEDTAWLRVKDIGLSDSSFSCLMKFADAQFVTVSRHPVLSR